MVAWCWWVVLSRVLWCFVFGLLVVSSSPPGLSVSSAEQRNKALFREGLALGWRPSRRPNAHPTNRASPVAGRRSAGRTDGTYKLPVVRGPAAALMLIDLDPSLAWTLE